MKYFIDFEFIEGFHKPLFGKRRHFIDLISVGIVSEDNRALEFISDEYKWKDADKWVQDNVIIPLYVSKIHGDMRNNFSAKNFNLVAGYSNERIANEILIFIYPDEFRKFYPGSEKEFFDRTKKHGWITKTPIEFYGYYSDYDWVLFCSLFGRMIDLPNGFPMYCRDLKQMMDERGVDTNHPGCPKVKKEHSALHDAAWNKEVYNWLTTIDSQEVDTDEARQFTDGLD